MQGEASRLADRESRDSFAAKLRESGNDAWEIGNELFSPILSAAAGAVQVTSTTRSRISLWMP